MRNCAFRSLAVTLDMPIFNAFKCLPFWHSVKWISVQVKMLAVQFFFHFYDMVIIYNYDCIPIDWSCNIFLKLLNNTFPVLGFYSIQKNHAVLTVENGDIVIKPGSDGAKIRVNGIAITGPRALEHMDRVIFGKHPRTNVLCCIKVY